MHNVLHVSMLRKNVTDPTHVLEKEPLELREDLSYAENPVKILDFKDQVLHSKVVHLVKVLWRNHNV